MWSVIKEIDNFIDTNNDIGIFVSGGYDSTVLAAYVFKYISTNNLKPRVTLYTVPRYDDSSVHAKRVCEWLSALYPSVEFTTQTVGNPDEHHSRQVLSGIMESIGRPGVKILLGDTAVPPELVDEHAPIRVRSNGVRVVQPFFDHDKTVTLKLAEWLGLLNEISEVTHTCTESKDLRCYQCWQCRERAWAFTKLLLVDTGTR